MSPPATPRQHNPHRPKLIAHSVIWIAGSTFGAALGLLFFHPTAFDLMLLGSLYFISNLGISVGFHRLLAHRAFEASSMLRYALLVMGCTAAQGAPAYWAVLHRQHHRHSDKEKDPHSPVARYQSKPILGFFHAHVGWINDTSMIRPDRASTDLLNDNAVKLVGSVYYPLALLGIILPSIAGWIHYGSLDGALRGAVWGGAVRVFLVHHTIWSINSVCHVWGTQRYQTGDSSRNNWVLAIPSVGESWHNNHHIAAASARFGHQWWELDIGYLLIRACTIAGLAQAARPIPLGTIATRRRDPQAD